jgi:hypothetical protein
MTFGEQVIAFHDELNSDWKLPKGFELIYPFDNPETIRVFKLFFEKYFNDMHKRHFLFGINPGRFGAGVTGVPFTDPKLLAETCGIGNTFDKRMELSSVFIYEMIEAMGGPDSFYRDFYVTSICPLGFIKDGKNINYYDDSKLEKAVHKHILNNFRTQLAFGCNTDVAFCIGQGKNFKFLQILNVKYKFFEEVVPLPHPRWVLQYRRKRKQEYLDEYAQKLSDVLISR